MTINNSTGINTHSNVHIAIIMSWQSLLEFTLFNSSNKCRTKTTKTADVGYDDIIYTPAVAIF